MKLGGGSETSLDLLTNWEGMVPVRRERLTTEHCNDFINDYGTV